MKFYKVKPEFDNWKLSRDFEIFVANELMTEREYIAALKKYANRNNTRRENIPPSRRDKVKVTPTWGQYNKGVRKEQTQC